MNWQVYPNTRISRLPRPLQIPAVAARNSRRAYRKRFPRWSFRADGLATVHFSPFLRDTQFATQYEQMVADWYPGSRIDARWRMWLATRLARQCAMLDGNFAEFGVYRAGCAFMILSSIQPRDPWTFYLFDTFSGIPEDDLTPREAAGGQGGRLSDTSRAFVERRLAPWSDNMTICEGDVLQTLPTTEVGRLAFVHFDLNVSRPTVAALEYSYPRLVRGAVALFDDYGFAGYEDQRAAIDDFFSSRSEEIVALPTGQAFVTKL